MTPVLAPLLLLALRYLWIGQWASSVMLTAGSVVFLWFASLIWPVVADVRTLDPDLKLKLLQSTGLLLTAFGLLLSYHNSLLNRFDATKPLFWLERSSSSGSSFCERNDGGWVMFLGSANKKYADQRQSVAPLGNSNAKTLWNNTDMPRCEFDTLPRRYEVVRGNHGGTFRAKNVSKCRSLFGWVDADGNFYEQKFELLADGPHVDAPLVRFRMRSWISWALQWVQLGERNTPWLPERDRDDKEYFDVTNE